MTSQTPPSIRPNARDAPAPGSAAADPDPDEKPPGLSVTQVVASALAAVSSTVLLSYLGVAGTIIGAGVASVLTVVGNNLYTRSILKTRRQMKAALQTGVVLPVGKNGRKVLRPTLAGSHSPGEGRDKGADDDVRETGQGSAVAAARDEGAGTTVVGHQDLGGTRLDDVHTAATQGPDGAADHASDGTTDDAADGTTDDATGDEGPASRRPSRRTLILSAVGVFLVLIVGVTLVEVVAGRPLSEILRGEEGSGTSISHVVSRESATTDGTTDGTTDDTSTDSPSRGTTPSPAPSETAPVPAPTDPPSTDAVVPDPEPTAPAPAPTPGTGTGTGTGSTGGASGGTSGSNGSGGTGTGTGAVPGPGTGNGAEGAPGSGSAGSSTES